MWHEFIATDGTIFQVDVFEKTGYFCTLFYELRKALSKGLIFSKTRQQFFKKGG